MALTKIQGGNPERGPGGTILQSQQIPDLSPIFTTIVVARSSTVGRANRFILADATNGAIYITLPSGPQTLPVSVKKIDVSANTVTIRPGGAGTIDGATTLVLANHNDAVFLVSNGVNWYASSIPISSGAAPSSAKFITQTPDASLTNEQALSLLATGYLKGTTGTGIVSSQAVPIPIADGGTNATTAAGALTSLGTTKSANTVWAGPTMGSAAAPTFRALVAADIPTLAQSQITNLTTDLGNKAANGVNTDITQLNGASQVDVSSVYKVSGTQVVAARNTGWTAPTGTPSKAGYDTATATLTQVAESLKAVIDSLVTHGLLGA